MLQLTRIPTLVRDTCSPAEDYGPDFEIVSPIHPLLLANSLPRALPLAPPNSVKNYKHTNFDLDASPTELADASPEQAVRLSVRPFAQVLSTPVYYAIVGRSLPKPSFTLVAPRVCSGDPRALFSNDKCQQKLIPFLGQRLPSPNSTALFNPEFLTLFGCKNFSHSLSFLSDLDNSYIRSVLRSRPRPRRGGMI